MAAHAPRSSLRRELAKDLLWIDRNIGRLVAVVFVIGVVLAIATAEPGTPGAALAEVLRP